MAEYIQSNLSAGEIVIKRAEKSKAALVWRWLFGILFCWLLLIPLFMAISASIRYKHLELAITNKRVMGRAGGFTTTTMDFILSKVYNVSVTHNIFGRMSNYGTVEIASASDSFVFQFVKNSDEFKNQICRYQEMAESGNLPAAKPVAAAPAPAAKPVAAAPAPAVKPATAAPAPAVKPATAAPAPAAKPVAAAPAPAAKPVAAAPAPAAKPAAKASAPAAKPAAKASAPAVKPADTDTKS